MTEPLGVTATWCDRIIRWSFYLLFILVPLILTPINYELFEYNKMMVTYGLTVIIVAVWLIKMLKEKEIRVAKTLLDIPIALFVASQFISALFSMDPHVSWFGYYSRFNGGMWSVITYVILYYAFVTNFGIFTGRSSQTQDTAMKNSLGSARGKKESRKTQKTPQPEGLPPFVFHSLFVVLRVTLATAVVVSIYAVLERLGIDKKIWVQDVQNRVFSTLGQPNWLAAYVVALTPVTIVFAWLSQIKQNSGKLTIRWNWRFILWNAVTVLFFTVLLFTRSRSGLLGFAVADILLWLGLFIKIPDKRSLIPAVAFIHIIFILIVFFNGSNISQIDKFTLSGIKDALAPKHTQQIPKTSAYTGPALETGGTESGTIRKYVWEAAVTAWKSSTKTLLIGTGTETFAFAFYQFRPAAHNMTSEWDFLYNKAHNEYLNYLATTGALGLVTYLIFLGVFIGWFIKQVHSAQFTVNENSADSVVNSEPLTVTIALFSGWISILITNFFGFSVVIMQIFLFLFPAMIIILSSRQDNKQFKKQWQNAPKVIGILISMVIAIILLGIILVRWYADTLYAKSYQIARSGQYAAAKMLIDEAIVLNPGEPVYHDERSTTLAALAVGALDQQQATIGGELAQQALAENDRALQISPQNVNFWKTKTKIYYSFSVYDPKFTQAAIEALTHAEQLSPNDPKILYNLAILNGRISENNKAIDYLKKSIQLKSDYRDAYYALYVFYTELKDPTNARAILETYLTTVDASDKQFIGLLGNTAK